MCCLKWCVEEGCPAHTDEYAAGRVVLDGLSTSDEDRLPLEMDAGIGGVVPNPAADQRHVTGVQNAARIAALIVTPGFPPY
jgi:hypothetical protein